MKSAIEIYEKYLDRIWNDLSKDDRVRLEGHFNCIINEIGDLKEAYKSILIKEMSNEK